MPYCLYAFLFDCASDLTSLVIYIFSSIFSFLIIGHPFAGAGLVSVGQEGPPLSSKHDNIEDAGFGYNGGGSDSKEKTGYVPVSMGPDLLENVTTVGGGCRGVRGKPVSSIGCAFLHSLIIPLSPYLRPFTFSSHYDLFEVAGAVSVAHEGCPSFFKCNAFEESGGATRREFDKRHPGHHLFRAMNLFILIVGVLLTLIRLSAALLAPCHRLRLLSGEAKMRISPFSVQIFLVVAAVVASAEALETNGDSTKEAKAMSFALIGSDDGVKEKAGAAAVAAHLRGGEAFLNDEAMTAKGRRLQVSAICPPGYIDCRNGEAINADGFSTGTCHAACNDGADCCGGCLDNSCDACIGATACIEISNGNCMGNYACQYLGRRNPYAIIQVSGGSCRGFEACYEASPGSGYSVFSISASCIGKDACRFIGPVFQSITASCTADYACEYLAYPDGSVTRITESCTAKNACRRLASEPSSSLGPAGQVGSITSSCIAVDSCRDLALSGRLGDIANSCLGPSCCENHCKNEVSLPTLELGGCPSVGGGLAELVDITDIDCTYYQPSSAPSGIPSSAPSACSAVYNTISSEIAVLEAKRSSLGCSPSSSPSFTPSSWPSADPSSSPSSAPSSLSSISSNPSAQPTTSSEGIISELMQIIILLEELEGRKPKRVKKEKFFGSSTKDADNAIKEIQKSMDNIGNGDLIKAANDLLNAITDLNCKESLERASFCNTIAQVIPKVLSYPTS